MSRSLPIALALAEAGYEIKYLGYDMAKEYMKKAGIEELCPEFSISDIKKGSPNPYWNTAEEFWSMIGYGNMPWVERKVDELIKFVKTIFPRLHTVRPGHFSMSCCKNNGNSINCDKPELLSSKCKIKMVGKQL